MYFSTALPTDSAYMSICRPVFVFQLIKDETLNPTAFPWKHTKAFTCCSVCVCHQCRQDRVFFLDQVLWEEEISSRACAYKQETLLSSPLYAIYKVSMEAVGGSWLTSYNTTTERIWPEVKENLIINWGCRRNASRLTNYLRYSGSGARCCNTC